MLFFAKLKVNRNDKRQLANLWHKSIVSVVTAKANNEPLPHKDWEFLLEDKETASIILAQIQKVALRTYVAAHKNHPAYNHAYLTQGIQDKTIKSKTSLEKRIAYLAEIFVDKTSDVNSRQILINTTVKSGIARARVL